MRNSFIVRLILLSGFLFSGCASTFDPRISASDVKRAGLPTVREVREGVEVSLDEYVSPHKSRKAFDSDIAPNGVLAILVRVENKGTGNYKIRRNQVRAAFDGQPLPPLHGYEAAKQGALRNATWNALVNTAAIGPLAMFFWPATMAGSATQTKNINQRIEHHFESLELIDTLLKPDETAAGFAFFKISEGSKRIENLNAEVIVEREDPEGQPSKQIVYKFAFPAIDLSTP